MNKPINILITESQYKKLFERKNTILQERIEHVLSYINEAYHISNTTKEETKKLLDKILNICNSIDSTKEGLSYMIDGKVINDIQIVHRYSQIKLFEQIMNLHLILVYLNGDADNMSQLFETDPKHPVSGVNWKSKNIQITIKIPNHNLDYSLWDVVQHEIEHLNDKYQKEQSSAKTENFADKTIYDASQKLIESNDIAEQTIGWLLYWNTKTEQTAFLNGCYNEVCAMLQMNPHISETEMIESLGLTNTINTIKQHLDRLSNKYQEKDVNRILKEKVNPLTSRKLTYNKLLQISKIILQTYKKIRYQAIYKAYYDNDLYDQSHEPVSEGLIPHKLNPVKGYIKIH